MRDQLRELGVSGINIGTKYGGKGFNKLEQNLLAFEVWKMDVSVGTFYGVNDQLALEPIYLLGDEE